MKVGIGLNINLSKLDKSRFVTGKNGTYADLTVFVDVHEKDQYGNSGGIKMALKEGETKENTQLDFVGNSKVFWIDDQSANVVEKAGIGVDQLGDDDVPF